MAISELQLPSVVTTHQLADAKALAARLAADVAERLRQAIANKGRACLVLSGGRSPVPFLDQLASAELDWAKVTVSLADERWVPVEHADSNAGLLARHLFKGPAAKARFIGLYQNAGNLEVAAEQADQALAELPPIDVLVLGMGDDGHTASLFPASPCWPALPLLLCLCRGPASWRPCAPRWRAMTPAKCRFAPFFTTP